MRLMSDFENGGSIDVIILILSFGVIIYILADVKDRFLMRRTLRLYLLF